MRRLIRRKWHTLVVATWNIGNGTHADALALMRLCHIVCFQEASDQAALKKALKEAGYGLVEFDSEPGQAAVFIAYDREHIELIRSKAYELLEKQFIGQGAGPDHNKPKWLIVGIFRHKASRRRVIVGATHIVPSQYNSFRLKAAIDQNERAENHMDEYEAATFVCADWNIEPDGKSLSVWRKAGWDSVMRAMGWLDTHGKRTIDDILFGRRSWVRLVKRRTKRSRSDHNAVIATFEVKQR